MMNYVHTNRLGSVVNLSDQHGRVTTRADYDDWGDVSAYESITVDGGLRVLLPELTYATHEYDDVLGQFYAKYRMYDAQNRRFAAEDMLKGSITNTLSLVQYLYVNDSPLVFIDPLGLVLIGTELREGARGKDIDELNKFLYDSGYLDAFSLPVANGPDPWKIYGDYTTKAVKEYQKAKGYEQTGTVTGHLWEEMGFTLNETLEEEFWSGRQGSDTINISISDNVLTINYSPKFYITQTVVQERKIYRQGAYYTVFSQCTQPVDEETYNEYVERAVQGLKYWENSINIQGVSGSVVVNINPSKASKKSDADINFDISSEARGITLGAINWKPGKATGFSVPLGWDMYRSVQSKGVDAVSNVSAHEFGHVLGLMDAYPELYNFNQVISKDQVDENNIMRSPYYAPPVITDFEYEMMLYAWSLKRMQGYFDVEVLAEKSEAFFR